ncbi:hypothetical protein LPJ74_003417 [Coemansia sp. RSA 1843]|nr:hypothetical protein LPJ74_003417 [Coemansia sp. RSA 1843]
MIDTLDCKFLHSTQSLAIKSMLDATKQPDNAGFVNEILNSTLNLHWPLLLRLESLSIAALHQLMHAFIDNRMLHTAFQIYRHAEKHIEPAQLKRLFATDALFAVLAKGLAQRGDVRSIMHLANVVTQRGIRMTLHFYTSLICGLLHGIKLRRLTYRHGRGQYAAFILERVQMAESVLEIVSRNNIYCPPKVYHAIMYGWALLGCPKMARRYFDKVSSLKLPSSRSNRSRSGASQTTWGILMYSYVCARDARGAIHVLDKAKKWMQESSASKSPLATMDDSDSDIHKTNHLINMAMAVLIGRRDAAGALELLDSYIERYASSQNMPDNSQTSQELLATPADPITLNLILRALLLSNQLQHAVTVYDTVHSEFKLLESPDALRPLLRYYFKKNDLNGVSLVTKRMFNLGGIPTLKELFYMVRLSVYEQDTALVLYLYDKMGIATASGTESKFVYFLKCKPEMVPLIYWALTANGRDADALDIESTFGEIVPNTSSGLLPSTPTQRRTAAVKEVHKRPIALYRDLLREINDFPLVELRRKLRYNVRFVFELYRDLKPNSPLVCRLLEDGNQQKKWLRSWHNDPEGCQLATYNSPALPDPTEPDKGSK